MAGMDLRYDTVFPDADDALFDYPRAEDRAFSRTCVRFGLADTPELQDSYPRTDRGRMVMVGDSPESDLRDPGPGRPVKIL